MSQNSPFSMDEYPMSMGSPFSIKEYCDGTTNTQSPSPLALSHEFLIYEYDYNEDLTYEEKDNEATTTVVGVAHTEVNEHNEPKMYVLKRSNRQTLCISRGFHVKTVESGLPL